MSFFLNFVGSFALPVPCLRFKLKTEENFILIYECELEIGFLSILMPVEFVWVCLS